ncbi:hypothetical protein BDC45DRAFT_506083 [Circinella umbellata]|nr:hypothetical protein BDC45DRAFT_506083 [Circinella umbellata]
MCVNLYNASYFYFILNPPSATGERTFIIYNITMTSSSFLFAQQPKKKKIRPHTLL